MFKNNLLIILIALLFPYACSNGRIYSSGEQGLLSKKWVDILRENPADKNENIKVTPLFKNKDGSHFIIQIKDREKPHIHETHDLTVIVKKGKGILNLGADKLSMQGGDIAFIPRGTLHYFVNTGREPAIAYVIFNPTYDGKDIKFTENTQTGIP
ncbi:MAG: hypothetical protein A3I04_05600 [Nitrospinae bacterium RIFCSPLOWO2_02_FULL_39_110]|nr:MAG: hypothetical protein A3D97_07430 [Nitrospinae bacterium RIFCSPHIGHO2_12_FULL_39_42]OGW01135.1 MAG: hypothetical protein A3D20_04520 [Nitrospinae bacterium RIFCSPHIGHO2_02_FULL_39_82]OGW04816.1 MAG: hypothetical protein A3I04_05600 [Nitrospinae bacterium RIFCSPLOWO2_02_FULL_39_110]OGW06864.1 MAG: hypothetical protein A2Z59_08860 [Nitrospinae bacterium RIFCSPLOWO2_02_39_17]OGW10139.1 MAG: hypothetical protein A3F81_06690 [Nitrospinae bacterium RIFCSPLOWO2_12_FULL_39_93]OGW11236.1 MAG: hy